MREGEFPPSRAKRGSSETICTMFCIENTHRHPFSFEFTLHCQVRLRSLHGYFVCARGSISRELSIEVGKLPTEYDTGPCKTGNY